jgi:hypothetical protein
LAPNIPIVGALSKDTTDIFWIVHFMLPRLLVASRPARCGACAVDMWHWVCMARYACKVVALPRTMPDAKRAEFIAEIDMIKMLDHPNTVKVVEVCVGALARVGSLFFVWVGRSFFAGVGSLDASSNRCAPLLEHTTIDAISATTLGN